MFVLYVPDCISSVLHWTVQVWILVWLLLVLTLRPCGEGVFSKALCSLVCLRKLSQSLFFCIWAEECLPLWTGNSILDFLISRHLVQLYPQLDPASLTHLKHATVNIENFASIALHHGLHVYLQKVSPKLTCQIRQFAILFWQEGGSAFGIGGQSSPRVCLSLYHTMLSLQIFKP